MPLDKILGSVKSNPAISGALGGAASGALVSAFLDKKTAKKLVKTGGLVAVGGLAYAAYQKYKSPVGQPGVADTALPQDPTALPSQQVAPEEVPSLAEPVKEEDIAGALVLQAMIGAAHADNQLDDHERERIWEHALSAGMSNDELAALSQEIEHPCEPEQLASFTSSMDQKIQVYTASKLVIGEGCEAGEQYLERLVTAMSLPRGLVLALNKQVAGA